jgi:hypothetical protein
MASYNTKANRFKSKNNCRTLICLWNLREKHPEIVRRHRWRDRHSAKASHEKWQVILWQISIVNHLKCICDMYILRIGEIFSQFEENCPKDSPSFSSNDSTWRGKTRRNGHRNGLIEVHQNLFCREGKCTFPRVLLRTGAKDNNIPKPY